MIDLRSFVRAGDGVWWSQGAAEPTPMVDALIDALPDIGPVRAFVGLCWNPRITDDPPPGLRLVSYGALGDLRHLPDGRLEVIRVPWSGLPALFEEGRVGLDVGFVQVAPPDADGNCSLGPGIDYAWDAAQHTTKLLAEVNAALPASSDAPSIPYRRFAAVVHTDRPLLEVAERHPRKADAIISDHIAALIEDGDTIQIGVGQIPSAVLSRLTTHRDLGVHSGVVTDGIIDLVESGIVTGARKEVDAGLVVTGTAMGTQALYERSARAPFAFRPVSYTHSPSVLARFGRLVAINSAVEVDLTGRVNAEVRGGHYVGAIGGQADFAHAAARSRGRSIIALPATSGGRSTIVPQVGIVSTPGGDVDYVVTEHGVAQLRGSSPSQRARRLVEVAAPEHREELDRTIRAAIHASA
ncbi:acetyl-CoA hydrolase/transferase family protein [Microbacterium aurum]